MKLSRSLLSKFTWLRLEQDAEPSMLDEKATQTQSQNRDEEQGSANRSSVELAQPQQIMDCLPSASLMSEPSNVMSNSLAMFKSSTTEFSQGSGIWFNFRLWKFAGSTDHQYEDAAAADPNQGLASIADGTTQGWRSDLVAESLVRYFTAERFRLDTAEERELWWKLARRKWFFARKDAFNGASSSEQTKIERGGSSTFLAIRMESATTYRLYEVGDCTLFWFRSGNLVKVEGANKHDYHPASLNTLQTTDTADTLQCYGVQELQGEYALLVTDALAKFLIQSKPWDQEKDFSLLRSSKSSSAINGINPN